MVSGSWAKPAARMASARPAPIAAALALAGGLVLAGVAGAAAQATPETELMASPAAGPCEAPAAAADPAGPTASPVATEATAEDGAPVGTPAADEVVAAAFAAVENYLNCWNAGDYRTGLALVTPNLLQTSFGVPDAATAELVLAGVAIPPYTVLDAGNVQTYDDGRASIDIVYLLGDHQYTNARWYLVMAGDWLLLDEEELLRPQPEGDTAVLSFSIADDAAPVVFDGATTTPALPVILLYGANNGAERHFFQVLRIPDEMAATPVAAMTMMMAGEFVGMLALGPGERQELALVNLSPGSYLLIDPTVAGSAATWTVTEPEPAA